MSKIEITCEFCGSNVMKPVRGRRFCGRSCSNKWQHANGIRNADGIRNRSNSLAFFQKQYGEEEGLLRYEKFISNMKNVTTGEKNGMFGKKQPKLSAYRKSLVGKSFDEQFGQERSSQIKAKISLANSGQNNPMFGKPSPKLSGNGVKGYYKEIFFRSLLELVCLKHFESRGIHVRDMKIEPIRIPYIDMFGVSRTYIPDILIPALSLLVEVKPLRLLKAKNNLLKFAAAEEYCRLHDLTFVTFTESDCQITKTDAINDENVILLRGKNEKR